jgi:hypothetical protein
MKEKFKSIIIIEKFLKDCYNLKVDKQNYEISYREFLKYFKDTKTITKHNLVVSINFTYGWMPTIFNFRSDNFNQAIKILNNAKKGIVPTCHQLDILKGLFNNSLVGTSKLLHFINPDKFAILDSRVYRYLTGKEPYNNRIGDSETYLLYLIYMKHLTEIKEYENAHNSICKKHSYKMTKLRTAELIMYINGAKKSKKLRQNIFS